MNTIRNIYSRARQRQSLTPGERAFLKLLQGLLCAALVAALPTIAAAFGSANVSWSDVIRTALAAGAVAVLLTFAKYLTAQGDPFLGDALTQGAARISSAATSAPQANAATTDPQHTA